MRLCYFCAREVNVDDPDTYRQVISWVNGPKLDGPKLRTHTHSLAHPECISLEVAGQAPDQPGLFEEINSINFCEEEAVKGTGSGICGKILDKRGQCSNTRNHIPF